MTRRAFWIGGWADITQSVDTVNKRIHGTTTSLSPFLLAVPDPTDAQSDLPRAHHLYANVPNPFNPSTLIRYDLPEKGPVRLVVFDARGRQVRSLVNGVEVAGRHQAAWLGNDVRGNRVASGVYFYRLQAGSYMATRRMVLLK